MAQTVTVTKGCSCDSLDNQQQHQFLWSSGDFSRTLLTSQFSDTSTVGAGDCYKCIPYKASVITTVDLPCKLLIVGDAGVGKTCFVQRYVSKVYKDKYRWTVGVDFALKVIKWSDDITVKLQMWDIAGQERFTAMTRVYYKNAHACIIMFDLSQRKTFLNALKWKRDLDDKCKLPKGDNVPCILLANKCDLEYREVEQSEIESFCKEQQFIGWTEVSVKDGLMIEESMRFLISDMVERFKKERDDEEAEKNPPSDRMLKTVNLTSQQPKSESKCKC